MPDFDSNLALVYFVFNSYFFTCREYEEDLIQEGVIGLLKAIETFDESLGNEFSTYAVTVIKNEMGMFMRKVQRCPATISLDDPIANQEGENITLMHIIADTSEDSYEFENEYVIDMLKKAAVENGLADVVKMRLEGMKQVDIARKLNVHPSTISEKMRLLYNIVRRQLGIPEK